MRCVNTFSRSRMDSFMDTLSVSSYMFFSNSLFSRSKGIRLLLLSEKVYIIKMLSSLGEFKLMLNRWQNYSTINLLRNHRTIKEHLVRLSGNAPQVCFQTSLFCRLFDCYILAACRHAPRQSPSATVCP